jgi:NAD(P)-dependent dehydrogenase (short-subunit alcohol dehydrogenase family)
MYNKILVVGASSNIGLSITKRLLVDGYNVVATFHTRSGPLNELQDVNKSNNNKLDIFSLDVKSINQINNLFSQKNLINNLKGLVFLPSIEQEVPLLDLELVSLQESYQVNFFSAVLLYQNFAKHLISTASPGSIVGLSSEITRFGGNNQFPYVASKASLNMLTMVSAKEWGAYNIRVNAVSPGKIAAGKNLKRNWANILPAPLGRLGTPDEVANTIAWLLSDQASYITGSVIPVNGGR